METNPGAPCPVPTVCRILCRNVLGLAGQLRDPTVASSRYDILLCSMTLVSDMQCVPELVTLSCCAKVGCFRPRGMTAYVCDGYGPFCKPKFEWLLQKTGF